MAVKDQGKGIAEELHDQIFKRFYESEVPFKRSIKGSGIGLAISKQMVELHSGKIKVDSKKGHGAIFIVTLPLGKQHFKSDELFDSSKENIKKAPVKSHKYILPNAPALISIGSSIKNIPPPQKMP